MIRLPILVLCAFGAAILGARGAPAADDYPQRSVTVVVPFPAGGATDLMARVLAEGLREQLKVPFVVENRPGAGTLIAAAAVAKAAPDGHTLMLATLATLAIAPHVYKSIPYDPVKDFAPIGLVGEADFVLVSHPSVPAETLAELIARVREKPGELAYASAGIGTPHHLFMEMFLSMTGLSVRHVPYRGSPAALTDVVAGAVPLMMCDLTPALQMIREKKVKAFGVASPTRLADAPEIPTLAEAGLPGYVATGWFSVVARAGTPRPTIDKLNNAIGTHLARADVQDKLAVLGIRALTGSPEELARHAAAELARWGRVAKDAGITPE